jgi:hypothetical protein
MICAPAATARSNCPTDPCMSLCVNTPPQLASANAVVNRLSGVMKVHNNALSFAPGSVEMAEKWVDGWG